MQLLGSVGLAALAATSGVSAMAAPALEPLAKPDLAAYWFAYVHFDPFADRYVLDAVAPSRLAKVDEAPPLATSEILAIARDGSRVQPLYTGRFEYRYKRALGDVVDDPASRVVTEYTCNVSDGLADFSRSRHPCGSRFTKPTRMEYWPTLGGMLAKRPGDLAAFSIAVPNFKEITRAVSDAGLLERLSQVPDALQMSGPAAAPLVWPQPLMIEAFGSSFKVQEARFTVGGVPLPADAHVFLRGEASLWGRTSVPLSEVRRVRIEERAGQCPMVQFKLQTGESKQFSRCAGSPFSGDVNGKLVDLEVLQGLAAQVRNGRVNGAATQALSFWLGVDPAPRQTPSLLRLTSLGALTAEETERMEKP